jgi:hypothetical protein
MSDVIGAEQPPDPAAKPATSRREVLRDLGSVLSAAAIIPIVPGYESAHHAGNPLAGAHRTGGSDGRGDLSSVLVPAYFPPAQFPVQWSALTDTRILAVVLNVDDGPGDAPMPEFVSAVSAIEAAGGTVTGYVDAGFGARSVTEM